jgi:hypothetical protein
MDMVICPSKHKHCPSYCMHRVPHHHDSIKCNKEINECKKCVSVQGEDHLLGATNG